MLKIKDTYINLKNVLYIEQYIEEPNGYNEFKTKFIINFIFGENYSYNSIPYKDGLGYNKIHERSSSERIIKRFEFTNKEEFDEVLNILEKVEE